jgi:hypothetical protein
MNQDHCSQTAGSAGMGAVGEVPVTAVVGWRDLWLFVVGPVKVVAAGFVGKAKRSAGNRRPVVPVVELYAGGSGSGQGRDCDCDWYGYGSCDSSDYGHRAAGAADVHKHDCNPDHLEMRYDQYTSRKISKRGGRSGNRDGGKRSAVVGEDKPHSSGFLCPPFCHTQTGPLAGRFDQSIFPPACDTQPTTHSTRSWAMREYDSLAPWKTAPMRAP